MQLSPWVEVLNTPGCEDTRLWAGCLKEIKLYQKMHGRRACALWLCKFLEILYILESCHLRCPSSNLFTFYEKRFSTRHVHFRRKALLDVWRFQWCLPHSQDFQLLVQCMYHSPRRCKTSSVGQSARLSILRSSVGFRQKLKKLKTQVYMELKTQIYMERARGQINF